MIKKIIIYLISSTLLLACSDSEEIKKFIKPAATLKFNIQSRNGLSVQVTDAKTGKTSIFNSSTGEEITPCKRIPFIITTTDKYASNSTEKHNKLDDVVNNKAPDCKVTLVNPSPEVQQAIESKTKVFKEMVRHNGKEKEATISTTTITSIRFKGSDCITEYSNGDQYQVLCVKDKDNCPVIYQSNIDFITLFPEAFKMMLPTENNLNCNSPCAKEVVKPAVIKIMEAFHPSCINII